MPLLTGLGFLGLHTPSAGGGAPAWMWDGNSLVQTGSSWDDSQTIGV